MGQPTVSDVHLDAVLTGTSVQYRQKAENFIASRVFPVVPVDKQSDKYYVFTKNDFLRDQMEIRPPGTPSAGSGYTLSTTSYYCDVWALHKDIDGQTRANYDSVLDANRNATQWLTQASLIRQERQWASDNFATSVWGTDLTPSNLWSDYTASDPITDIETGKRTILANTGLEPNTLVLGYDVFIKLKNHPDIVDRIKYTSDRTITAEMLGAMFDVPRVFVAKSVYASNLENETAAYSFIHGKHALLCYVTDTPGKEVPSAGYQFMWKNVSGPLGGTVGVKNFRMEDLDSDRIEIQIAFDNKIVGTDLGYFFNGAVS